MAEQAVDQIVKWLEQLDKAGAKWDVCRTAEQQLLDPVKTDGVSGILPPKFDPRVVEHFCLEEWAVHLDDVMVRRSSWHYYFRDAWAKAEQVADWMAALLDWTKEEKLAELRRYEQILGMPNGEPVFPGR